ncbi:MAG: hypothetical protein LBC96_09325 [Lachnospiraceae bacterium]|jgi:uncharacterized ubiquitin-like protein YukD|nr:hypothetical protein [Lachnospiraceae bacterium]
MYLTITLRLHGNEYDIQADSHLPISHALTAVCNNLLLQKEASSLPLFLKSAMQSKIISSAFTFEQGEVQNGDILTLLD